MSAPTVPAELAEQLRGELITPADPAYDAARVLYNASHDRHPALIVRCRDVADVIAALAHARSHALPIAIRAGSHHGAGLGSVDDGLVVDLSPMRGVIVDPASRVARVQGGALLGDLDHALSPFGLAVPAGVISTTGIGGLTLGGGIGHLMRTYGLTIDNLLAADVVLADGRLVQASAEENEDLFWALRGGGGNFGVVVSFSFRLRPVGSIVAGPTLWPLEAAGEVLSAFDTLMASAPDELNAFFAYLTVPPGPPFPPELHLKKMCGVVWCYVGRPAEAAEAMRPLTDMQPALHGVGPMPFAAWQSAFDALYPAGQQQYWRAHFLHDLPDGAIAAHLEQGPRMPTPLSTMHLYAMGGAAGRAPGDATAWAHRDARYAQVIFGVDPDAAQLPALRTWCQEYWKATRPFAEAGAYVNFMMDEGEDRVRASYGANYPRLTRVKAVYDPDNAFRVNQNIRPAAA